MHKALFWKLFLIVGLGAVALFYVIDLATSQLEKDMSLLADPDRDELRSWGDTAEAFLHSDDSSCLEEWLRDLQHREQIWAAVAQAEISHIAGSRSQRERYTSYNMGRSIDWQIHLWFEYGPIMELPLAGVEHTSLLVELPARMRPGSYWREARLALQIVVPLVVMVVLVVVLYVHIMAPLRELQRATRSFSEGRFDVRLREVLGTRGDEIGQLAETFDQMAERIGELFLIQRQLLTDLSHELRTPLTRLDIAAEKLAGELGSGQLAQSGKTLDRIQRESRHIRKLVDDTLTLAWLRNEAPRLEREQIDLVDLIEVLIDDAEFEYPDRLIARDLPSAANVEGSNHRALGQALENILRNALRYTPQGKTVSVRLREGPDHFAIQVSDEGPGVPEQHLASIFKPFFRVESSRTAASSSFGLGLALARRQLEAIAASVRAVNLGSGGLLVTVTVPQQRT
ncbi:MAG: histidine kinase sensor domain-containing protein [Pseudomonadota bacterium]